MKNKDLIKELQQLDPELEIYVKCSGSGCSYTIECVFRDYKQEYENIGPIEDLKDGTEIIKLIID